MNLKDLLIFFSFPLLQFDDEFEGSRTLTLEHSFDQGNMSRIMRKPDFYLCENKCADRFAVTAQLISAFVFATRIIFLKSLWIMCEIMLSGFPNEADTIPALQKVVSKMKFQI